MTLPADKNLKPVTIYRQDGSSEIVYIDPGQPSLRDNLFVVYVVVAIVAFSLTGYLTVLQLKKAHNGK